MKEAAGSSRAKARLSLHDRVRGAYDELAPAERLVADLVLHFPGELHGYTGAELAKLAKTSNAAVSRFVRRLGFSGYEEMRVFARDQSENGSPVALMGRTKSADPDILRRHADTVVENVQRTVADIDPLAWSALLAAIADARRVWINGFRHGYYIAGYLRWSLAHVRDEVRLLPVAGETFGETLVDVGKGDVAIMLAMRRRIPATRQLIGMFRSAGARVAVLTDSGMADTHGAEWVLRCQSVTKGPVDDHASAVVLAHALTEGVINRLGPAAKKRFAAIDALHDGMSELD